MSLMVYLGVFALLCAVLVRGAAADDSMSIVHQKGVCLMSGQYGLQPLLHNKNATVVDMKSDFVRDFREVCGISADNMLGMYEESRLCCDDQQLSSLMNKVMIAQQVIGTCPACWQNFLNFFCHFTCSPDQSTFLQLKETEDLGNNQTAVKGVYFHVNGGVVDQFYDSCAEVKMIQDNSLAMKFIGNGAKNGHEFLSFMGRPTYLNPVEMIFPTAYNRDVPGVHGDIAPFLYETFSCNDDKYGCSCVDCFAACKTDFQEKISSDSTCFIGNTNMTCLFFSFLFIYSALLLAVLLSTFGYRFYLYKRGKGKYQRVFTSDVQEQGDREFDDDDDLDQLAYESTATLLSPDSYGMGYDVLESDGKLGGDERKQYDYKPWILDRVLSNLFYKLGLVIARNAYSIVIISVLVSVLGSAGWFKADVETEPLKLWVDPNDMILRQKQYFDENFAPFYRVVQLIVTRIDGGNVIDFETLNTTWTLQEKVESLNVTHVNCEGSSQVITLDDLCFKPVNDRCAVQSFTGYYQHDYKAFLSDANKMDEDGKFTTLKGCILESGKQECYSDSGQPLSPMLVLGGSSRVNSTTSDGGDDDQYQSGSRHYNDWLNSKSLVVTFVLNNSVKNESYLKKSEAWEHEAVKLISQYVDNLPNKDKLKIAYSTEISIEDELVRETYADVYTIVLSYILMFVYASLALGTFTVKFKQGFRGFRKFKVESKFFLGVCGILIVIASVSLSVSILSVAGQKATLIIAEVIPFLVLAVGVDNIFILVNSLERVKRQYPDLDFTHQIALNLKLVGPSIMLSSLCETVAFGSGFFVTMPAVSIFSLYAATAVFVNFCLQSTCFIALMVIDTRIFGAESGGLLSKLRIDYDKTSDEERRDEMSALETLFNNYYAPALLKWYVKPLVVILFASLFMFLGLQNFQNVQLGLEQKLALPSDSYLLDYFDALENELEVGPPLYFVIRTPPGSKLDIRTTEGQKNLCGKFLDCNDFSIARMLEMEYQRNVVKNGGGSTLAATSAIWIDDFVMFMNKPGTPCCYVTESVNQCFVNGDPDDEDDPFNHVTSCACWKWRSMNPSAGSPGHYPLFQNYIVNQTTRDVPALPTNSTLIMQSLEKWLDVVPGTQCPTAGKAAYKDSIAFGIDENGEKYVKAYYLRSYHQVLRTQDDFINAYKDANRIAKSIEQSLNLDQDEHDEEGVGYVYPYSVFYVFFSQYLTIWSLAFTLIGLALAVIFVMFMLFVGSPLVALLVVITVMSLVVNLIGVMAIWSISLNAVSTVNLVIAVGIGVEFCVHVARGATVMSTQKSLTEFGSSVFSGITMTKLLGIFVLAYAKSKIFEVFYFRMYLTIVLLGAAHGLILLPVLLEYAKELKQKAKALLNK
ncbi:hypothetical protein MIR68_010346 [Amoeboaphelidium protococcarum]|nr:hypothetical protein MIR68_010346 [Amoeboaphelidium protococcarum]